MNGGLEFRKHETVLTVASFIEIDRELVDRFTQAARTGDASKVVVMVEGGMPVDIAGGDGRTALAIAACYNQTDVVRCLLDKGANVNKQDLLGMTALHWASYNNHTDVMRMLLQHGARKDITDNYGLTPIDRARLWDRKEVVDLMEQY